MTTEVLPRPRAVDGVVFTDVASRTLTVRLSELASGYDKLLWREAWGALRRAQEAGWPVDGAAPVWADAPGARKVVHGQPVDGGALAFTFLPGVAGFAELVGTPRLRSILTLDTSSRRFLTCRFLNGPEGR